MKLSSWINVLLNCTCLSQRYSSDILKIILSTSELCGICVTALVVEVNW